MQIDALKKLALEIADAVEKEVKKAKQSNKNLGEHITMGADGTPTEWIDKLAEDVTLQMAQGQHVNILSEEKGYLNFNSDYTFVIDPIDGTRNAIHNIPFYAFSLAIGKKKLTDVLYGLVRNIPTGDTFTAEKGKGAYLNGKKISVEKNFTSRIISPVLGKSGDQKTWRVLKDFNIRSLGSAALEMCLVASGSTNAYLMGKELLRVTDIAASTLIVREAGGEVYNAQRKKLDMDLTLQGRTSVIAVSSPNLLEVLL